MKLHPVCFASCLFVTTLCCFAETPMLTPTAYGKIRFGDPLNIVEKKLGEQAERLGKPDDTCYAAVRFKRYPGFAFLINENDHIHRADAPLNISNTAGVYVGMHIDDVKRKHPRIFIEPHKYWEHGHTLILPKKKNLNKKDLNQKGLAMFVFETDNSGHVTQIRAGLNPEVQYVESCL